MHSCNYVARQLDTEANSSGGFIQLLRLFHSQLEWGKGENDSQKGERGASLVAQWLRICLLMQGTRVRALVWEDPTCRGAAEPVHHSY